MKLKHNITALASLCFIMVLCTGCASLEIQALAGKAVSSLLFIMPFVAVVVGAIFLMNKYITDEKGRTNERLCSIVGVLVFPIIFTAALGFKFGFGWLTISLSIAIGAVIGWFSYTLDELLESFWENKVITLPAVLGLVFGGWFFTTMFTHTWLEGNMYVTHHACAKMVIIERWTQHISISTDDKGHTTTSYYEEWDYHHHAQRIALGSTPPELFEGRDYSLGHGYAGRRDRVGRMEVYLFLGGHFWSEDDQVWRPFRWLRLSDPSIGFLEGKIQVVMSDFYGNPIGNGGLVREGLLPAPPNMLGDVPLPENSDLPPPTVETKILSLGLNFFNMLFTEHEYRPVLYFFLSLLGLLGLGAAFVPPLRVPILVFLACASIIALLFMFIAAAKTGKLPGVSRRRTSGGGGFGGRSLTF